MPWETVELNDGNHIKTIGYGTWTIGKGDQAVDQIAQALETGYDHIDTAQSYLNQEEVGQAVRESGLKRSDLFITTKFSGRDGLSIPEAIKQSLDKTGFEYVDLYLIHHPRLVGDDVVGAWQQMEELKAKGYARSIGVSNFGIDDLEKLKDAKTKPAVNQILLHPYVWKQQKPLVEYCQANGIVVEAYSSLISPVTRMPGGPVDKPLAKISERTGATYDQILLAWAKAKGAVVVTNSSKKARLLGYLDAGDLLLTDEEIAAVDEGGSQQGVEGYGLFARVLPGVALFSVAFVVSRVLISAGVW
ncbi:Aldo/keto reductase [Exidia glandulosa HHB12029]|uniref:Aldo/keto reductase n=1 Tax=Exidia glandulosa HHB12029 TaxID=1314781 RepID=A0A165GJM2_EXIGL|nr:Aldo/keto reductase [Exidia glandulosa HHB12029]